MSSRFFETIENSKLRQLYTDWNRLRGDRDCPSRADIDPIEFKYLLGNIALIDVLYRPLHFRFRLVGTHLVTRWGFDLTRKMLDDFPNQSFRGFLRANYIQVVTQRRPVRGTQPMVFQRQLYDYEFLWLPLSGDGRKIDMIMSGVMCLQNDGLLLRQDP